MDTLGNMYRLYYIKTFTYAWHILRQKKKYIKLGGKNEIVSVTTVRWVKSWSAKNEKDEFYET